MTGDRDLLLLSVFTFLTVSLWVFFELTKTVKTTTVSPQIQTLIAPLDTTLDGTVLDILEARDVY